LVFDFSHHQPAPSSQPAARGDWQERFSVRRGAGRQRGIVESGGSVTWIVGYFGLKQPENVYDGITEPRLSCLDLGPRAEVATPTSITRSWRPTVSSARNATGRLNHTRPKVKAEEAAVKAATKETADTVEAQKEATYFSSHFKRVQL